MYNIESLARKAVNEIKLLYGLPKSGFVAGGSLSNLIWEFVSGNKAIINDIDIFVFDDVIGMHEVTNEWYHKKKLYYLRKEIKYFEDDYSGFSHTSSNKEFYIINDTENDGIYNYIKYSANTQDPQLIINSFDINCTQIGYSIKEDKFYYTDEFKNFLETGELKLTNILSPAHSSIRLFKKKYELNAKLDEIEVKMCQYCLQKNMTDINRKCFSRKYAEIYKKYQSDLDRYYKLRVNESLTKLFKEEKNIDTEIYELEIPSKEERILNDFNVTFLEVKNSSPIQIFEDENITKVFKAEDLLFYFRNIRGNEDKIKMWDRLHLVFHRVDYIDCVESEENIKLLEKLIMVAPEVINNLKYLTLSQQIKVINNLFDMYKEDPIIAISILEKVKLDPDIKFDDSDLLLLELSVRKSIISDTSRKVERLFGDYDPTISSRYF